MSPFLVYLHSCRALPPPAVVSLAATSGKSGVGAVPGQLGKGSLGPLGILGRESTGHDPPAALRSSRTEASWQLRVVLVCGKGMGSAA